MTEWLTPQIVALMAGHGLSAADVRDWIHDGELKAARIHSASGHVRWLIHHTEAKHFIERITHRSATPSAVR